MKLFLPLLLSVLLSFRVSAQLSGSYRIGYDSTADFKSVTEGIYALKAKGAKGDVFFNLIPGKHPIFTIDSVKTMNGHRLYIQSLQRDSSTVVIEAIKTNAVVLMEAVNVTLRDLTLVAKSSGKCLYAKWTSSCELDNCLLLTPNQTGRVGEDVTVRIRNESDGKARKSMAISNCIFRGGAGGFNMTGYMGILTVDSCQFEMTGRYGIYANWIENMSITNSELRGEISTNWASGGTFKNNVVFGSGDFSYRYVTHNDFKSTNTCDVDAQIIRHNTFAGMVKMGHGGIVDSNLFKSNISFSRMTSLTFKYNDVQGDARFLWVDVLVAYGNAFRSNCSISRSILTFKNNLIYGKSIFSFESGSIAHNNFGGYVSMGGQNIRVNGNNFSGETNIGSTTKSSHNNYYPGFAKIDKHSYHIDPQYVSKNEMRAQNPLLIGAGMRIPSLKVDMDGNPRDSIPTIGAHAFCVPQYSELGTLDIFCGNSIRLKKCPSNKTAGAFWVSEWGDIYKTATMPIVSPPKTGYYFYVDQKGEHLDSAHLRVNNFTFNRQADTTMGCNHSIQMSGGYHPLAQYSWRPTRGLSDTTSYNPIAMPKTTTKYFKTVKIPGCGTFYDTISIEVDRQPWAFGTVVANNHTATFTDHSQCADSIYWDFGDGHGSSDSMVNHNYKATQTYRVVLSAFSGTATDSLVFHQWVSTGLSERNIGADINLYPNPSSGIVWIENDANLDIKQIQVLNAQSKVVKTLERPVGKQLYLPSEKGIYFVILHIEGDHDPVYQKVIVN